MRAKRKNEKTTTWRFGFFRRSSDRYTPRALRIVSFRQFSVTEKAFARKKNRENRAIRNFPSELAF